MKSVFLTPETPPRLRLLWRLLGFFLLVIAASFALGIPYAVVTVIGLLPDTFFARQVLSALAIVLAVFAARRWLDRRTVISLGLALDRRAARDTLAGIAIAAAMMALVFALHLAPGWARLVGPGASSPADWAALLGWLVVFLFVGFYEELLSRGYLLQNLEDGLNTGWAVFLSSAVFGLLHISNPNASLVAVAGILGAGLLFAYAYLRTRSLWLAIGLHIGWNVFEGVVFGFPVSGLDTPTLIEIQVTGPPLWTGGAFGPEAGLLLLPGLLAGAALVWLYTRPQS
ncbi:MAG: CPBP family intramembrane metalloprotease [Chloroflexi bacterium]|nr:CPBP family intramembrane metalloprotease [Chloroflexota bacterium]